MIKGYMKGANISLLNTLYIKPKKDEETGKYGSDYLYIIFKDLDTNQKKVQLIKDPTYRYYMTNNGVPANYNRLFIEDYNVHPVECRYRDLKLSIAKETNNYEWFMDNIKSGNYRDNDKLFSIPSVFCADIHIEDYYRFEFNKLYRNEPYTPTKLYFDIETDIKDIHGDFPEPGECPVNAITLVDDANYKVYTLLLENYSNPLIEQFKNTKNLTAELKDFVRQRVGGWKQEKRFGLDKFEYKIVFFDNEINLIEACFNLINYIKPDFALAWNIAFDLPYLIARIQVLGYNPANIICHPDFEVQECYYYIDRRADKFEERGDYAQITSYTVYMDQLITFASRRKGQRALSGFKLDYIGDKIAGVRKLDYSHITNNLADLPYLDYHTFVFYNVMDTIVQLCVEHKVGDVDFVFNKAMTTNTRFAKVHRQTTYLVNRGIQDFYNMGYIMGNNINKSNQKTGFAGAFVADPKLVSDKPKMKINDKPVNLLANLDDFDYKALYPSIIAESNMAPNTMVGKVFFPEQLDPKENRFNNEYFDRSVWFMEDLVSGNVLDFCQRYLGMMSYEQMYYSVLRYFREVINASRAPRYVDTITGLRFMYHLVDNTQKRLMYRLVDNGKDRNQKMCIIQERMPKYDGTNHDKNNNR